jgi:hypothetical protein
LYVIQERRELCWGPVLLEKAFVSAGKEKQNKGKVVPVLNYLSTVP